MHVNGMSACVQWNECDICEYGRCVWFTFLPANICRHSSHVSGSLSLIRNGPTAHLRPGLPSGQTQTHTHIHETCVVDQYCDAACAIAAAVYAFFYTLPARIGCTHGRPLLLMGSCSSQAQPYFTACGARRCWSCNRLDFMNIRIDI